MDVGAVISAIHAASEMGRAPGNEQGEKDTTQNDSNNSLMIPFLMRCLIIFHLSVFSFTMGLAKSVKNVYTVN